MLALAVDEVVRIPEVRHVTGQFGPGDHWGVTAIVRYWTFVDVMWLAVVFPVLYLL